MPSFELAIIFFLFATSFMIAMIWTPFLTYFLYKHRVIQTPRPASNAPIKAQLHAHKKNTPTMGGILIWGTVLAVTLMFFYLAKFSSATFLDKLNFLSRSETFLPLGALIASALVGLGDDLYNIWRRRAGKKAAFGFGVLDQLILLFAISVVGAWWFYYKLDWDLIHVPFVGNFELDWWYIPLFIFIIMATGFSVKETDGADGLAGGTLLVAFGSFGAIAMFQEKYDLAALCAVIVGALLAFLWFNIYPARFFMGATGSISLGVTLGIIAMLTNSVLLLPIIGFIFVLESFSVIIQVLSKKFRKKKIFLSTPIHHHFEAKGWPEPKVVMRAWVIADVVAVIGIILAILDAGF